MKIAYLFNTGRFNILQNVRAGKSPSDFFYGAIELEKKGYEIGFHELVPHSPVKFPYAFCNIMLNKGWSPAYMDGGLVRQCLKLCDELSKYDCIVATTSGIAFALGLLKKIKALPPPLVSIQCGIFNNPYKKVGKHLTSALMEEMHNVYFGEGEFIQSKKVFSSAKINNSVCQYGVDLQFWGDGDKKKKKSYVLCVGNDGRRDFDCLLRAAHLISSEIRLLTRRKITGSLSENVTLLNSDWGSQSINDYELKILYQEALCVVIPLIDSVQPSGQSVALQAMACGTPVVITETPGFWDRRVLRDEKELLFIKGGDPIDLARKVNRILEDRTFAENIATQALNCLNSNYSIEHFSQCIESCCAEACKSHMLV